MLTNITENCKITLVGPYTAAATTAMLSTAVDMQGYDAVCFVRWSDTNRIATITGSDTGATATDYVALLTPTVTTTATGQTVVLEVVKPTTRFLKLNLGEGTSGVVGPAYAIQSQARNAPVSSESAIAMGFRVARAVTPTT